MSTLDPNAGVEDFVEEIVGNGEAPTEPKVETSTTPTPPNDDLRAAMTELAGTVTKLAQPKNEPKTLSDDEIAEQWAVFRPEKKDPEFFRKFLRLNTDMEPAEVEKAVTEYKKVWAVMQDGIVRQSVVGARNLISPELAKLRDEIAPLREYVSQQRAEQTRSRFFSSYESLADPKFGRVLDTSAKLLEGKTFTDEASYFKALAESAADAIKGLVPGFDLGAKATKTKPAVTSPRLPRTSVGGTGGSGSGGGEDPSKKKSDDDIDSLDF